ncbi:MAG: polysaccharide biosynthesis tyrosine autokinase [Deltaproteobacteria bacterium]|nr:polysaccharide biosynthesis tyrosine autokinase [Deltaproteobacteria bacterium]
MKALSADVKRPEIIPADGFPFPDAPGLEEEGAFDLWEYWRRLKKHSRLIVACFLTALLLASLYLLTATPIYTATATVLIERKAPQALAINGTIADQQGPDDTYYRTQYEILKSRGLALQVIQEQRLDSQELFSGKSRKQGFLTQVFEKLIGGGGGPSSEDSPNPAVSPGASGQAEDLSSALSSVAARDTQAAHRLVGTYLGMLAILPVPRTSLVKIAISTPDPQLSAALANAHARIYMRQGVERLSRTDEEAQSFLEDKLVELKDRLEKSEAALNAYRRDKGVISFDDKDDLAAARLADLNKSLTEAETQRIALEAQIPFIRKGDYDVLPGVVDNALVQALKQQLMTLEKDRSQLIVQFKPEYPRVVEIEAQIADTRRRLQEEMRTAIRSLESTYTLAATREKELRARMEEQKTEALRLKDVSVMYSILAREVDTNRQLYDSVLQRIKEIGMAAELHDSNTSVIDAAESPRNPSYPRKFLSLMMSAFFGLFVGVGVALFLEYLDSRLHSREEVERYLHLPSLTIIPDFKRLGGPEPYGPKPPSKEGKIRTSNGSGRSAKEQAFANGVHGKAPTVGDLVLHHHAFSPVAESYRTLRTSLLLSRAEAEPKVVLFTSAMEGEGKTSTVINAAIIFAQLGLRVVVLDADLRRSRCHEMLSMEKGLGLSELLAGRREVHQVIKPTAVDNLFLVTGGATPPNPAELLYSRKMRETLAMLRDEFDCVFIDSPPVMPVSDPLLLATMVDGVVLVVNGQATPRKLVREACSRLDYVQAKILGVVLNQVDIQREGYDYYYGYYAPQYSDGEAVERPLGQGTDANGWNRET